MKLFFATLLLTLTAGTALAHNPRVEMQTSQGNIVIELYKDKAPITVENFLHYVNSGYYTGTIFHRVIKDFVVQGGAFDQALDWRKPDDGPIPNEAKNGLTNEPGTIAMADARDPNSATTQFFFNLESNKHLNHYRDDPGYYGQCVFGKIVKGMDVVQKIADLKTGPGGPFTSDVPATPVVIEKVVLLPDAAPTQLKKPKGKSNGKTKNKPRRHLAGT